MLKIQVMWLCTQFWLREVRYCLLICKSCIKFLSERIRIRFHLHVLHLLFVEFLQALGGKWNICAYGFILLEKCRTLPPIVFPFLSYTHRCFPLHTFISLLLDVTLVPAYVLYARLAHSYLYSTILYQRGEKATL